MRPAQLTPENSAMLHAQYIFKKSFNEAGAINAGKHAGPPANALNVSIASMRPAQLTPENAADPGAPARGGDRFNEAGAINAGKRNGRRIGPCNSRGFNEAGAINAGKLRGRNKPGDDADMLQ